MDKVKVDELVIDGTTYVPKGSEASPNAKNNEGLRAVIVRGKDSGVQFGYLESHSGQHTLLRNAIRIWYWSGASSLSQLAVDGVANPDKCKFAVPVDTHEILDSIEIIQCSEKAVKSIEGVKSWKK